MLIADPLLVASKQKVENVSNDAPLASDQLGKMLRQRRCYSRLTPGRTNIHSAQATSGSSKLMSRGRQAKRPATRRINHGYLKTRVLDAPIAGLAKRPQTFTTNTQMVSILRELVRARLRASREGRSRKLRAAFSLYMGNSGK